MKHFLVRRQRDIVPVNPLHVRPSKPAVDTVGVALSIGMRVMLAMNRHPSDRIALQRERSENRQQVFDRLNEPQTAVG